MGDGATIVRASARLPAVRMRSYAKINLYLDVLGRRADGYHELDTVFQTIALHDIVELELDSAAKARRLALEVTGEPVPADSSNLVWRAAEAYADRWCPKLALRIRLHKQTPVGAGLGGGSSNCAAVLVGLRHLLGRPPKKLELLEVAPLLGADVPFFLFGGSARGRGRGDRIEPLADLEPGHLVLGLPRESISTSQVFRSLNMDTIRRPPARNLPTSLDPRQWVLGNDLEPFVLNRFPSVKRVYNALQEIGSSSVQLSGSGGAVFTFVEGSDYDLDGLNRRLEGKGRLWLSHTVPARAVTEGEVSH